MKKVKKTGLEKLKEAWENAPEGAKAIVFEKGYKHQTVSHILLNGRKDENIILELLDVVKKASKQAYKNAQEANKLVQAL